MPRLRLHKSSFVVGTVVGIILVLIMIPGRIVDGFPYSRMTLEHGWPFNYLRRQSEGRAPNPPYIYQYPSRLDYVAERPMLSIPWLSADNWRFWEANVEERIRRWDFNGGLLFVDVVASSLVLVAAVGLWEFRRRRRPKLFTFRIGDMLVAVASVSTVLGWAAFHQREFQGEDRFLNTNSDRFIEGSIEGDYWFDDDLVCIAPTWTRSLIGERLLPEFAWRTCKVVIHAETGENARRICDEIEALDYLKEIIVWDGSEERFQYSELRTLAQLETLIVWCDGEIDVQDVDQLKHLTQLYKIVIDWKEDVPSDVLTRLQSALPACKIVDVYDDW